MKNSYLSFLALLICQFTFAQDFSFDLIFTDANGNKDTLILGFDVNAGDSIDTVFGEKNIKDTAWNGIFEVRVGSEYLETKTQIKENKCSNERIYCSSELYVLCKHWPLTISWDHNLLNNNCSKYSVLTDCSPGGWFDTGHSFIATLAFEDNVVVNDELFEYHVNNNDTIRSFYIDLGNEGKYGSMYGPFENINDKNSGFNVELIPNPANETISVIMNSDNIIKVNLFSLDGYKILEYNSNNFNSQIDLSEINAGIYILTIETTHGKYSQKIIKE